MPGSGRRITTVMNEGSPENTIKPEGQGSAAAGKTRGFTVFSIFVALASAVLTFFLVDVALRAFLPVQYTGEKTFFEGKDGSWGHCYPYYRGTSLPLRRIDPNSGRDAACVLYDPAARARGFFPERRDLFLVVGDSFAFGEGVPDTETLGYLLGEKVQQFNFITYGLPGADVSFVANAMKTAFETHPDIRNVLYFYNLNDVLMSKKIAGEQKFIVDFQNVRWFNTDAPSSAFRRILEKSAALRLLERAVVLRRESALTVRNYRDMYDAGKNGQKLAETFETLASMNKFAAGRGAALTVVIYPLLYRELSGEYPFRDIHRTIEAFCVKYGVTCVDGLGAFDAVGDIRSLIVHPLDYHPNATANRLMVDYLVGLEFSDSP